MSTSSGKNRRMVQVALMAAIVVVVSFVPFLGYIPLVVIKATTVHIPVIIGAILLGPKAGAFLGGVFGVTSIIKNTFEPSLTSFCFSPLIAVPGTDSGSIKALLIALAPRILLGLIAGLVYKWVSKKSKKPVFACVSAAVTGSLANTLLVMGGIYLLFGAAYASAREIPMEMLSGAIRAVVFTNGVAEALVAAILSVLIAYPLSKVIKPQHNQ